MTDSEHPIRSICILRLSSIGDVTHVIPVILSLQKQLPQAKITWVIGKNEAQLVAGFPCVEWIIFDKQSPIKSFWTLKQQCRQREFDVLLHMQSSGRANLCALLISAKMKIGFDKIRGGYFHQWMMDKQVEANPKQHVCDDFMSFLPTLGLQIERPSWSIPLLDNDWKLSKQMVLSDQVNIIVSPCSSHSYRNWLPEHYAAIADYAITQHGARVIFVGSPRVFEKQFVAKIQSFMRYESFNLVGKDTLKQLCTILSKANLLISPDSGPAHIANAMGTDVIGLYAATNPYRSGPYHSLKWCINRYPEAMMLSKKYSVNQSRWGRKLKFSGVMALITVDDVMAVLDRWFKERRSS